MPLTGQEFVDNFLTHYASPYYNPQKAHEYYLRTRQLKDKNAQSALKTKNQRDTFAVVRDSVGQAKVAEAKKLSTTEVERVATLNRVAREAQTRIEIQLANFARPGGRLSALLQAQKNGQNRIAQQDAVRQLQKVGNDLQDAVQTARDDYRRAIGGLDAKYQKILDNEKTRIHNEVR